MRLSKVELKNFRALTDVVVELDDTTVLIGENNSGKTSFLEALKMCLTIPMSKRAETFDDYDHHLPSLQAKLGDAGDTAITLHFTESAPDEWDAKVMQMLDGVINVNGDLSSVVIRLSSKRDATAGEMQQSWEFLDNSGNPHRPRGRNVGQILRDLQQIKPFFYLSAMRDAGREFQPKSPFWGPFLRNPGIADEVREQIEAELAELNAKVIGADSRLQDVRDRLAKTSNVVTLGGGNAVSIEAVPGRTIDLLNRAQIAITGKSGAKLPLSRHGAGTQSLSVLFLFEAFLSSMLEKLYSSVSVPVIALEEPEAHLHPAATRSVWSAISDLPGQKIVATHSGDLLSRVPLSKLRRFHHTSNGIAVCRVNAGTLSADDERKLTIHVRATRGELLFARTWLLVEGATEVWLLEGIAELLGMDLEREGVRIIQYSQVEPDPFVKLANSLGISWHCLTDGDEAGQKYRRAVEPHLQGRPERDHITTLAEKNIEVHLCVGGFGQVYRDQVPKQNEKKITKKLGEAGYWEQVEGALPGRGKEKRVIEVVDEMRKLGTNSVSLTLKNVLQKVRQLSGGSHAP